MKHTIDDRDLEAVCRRNLVSKKSFLVAIERAGLERELESNSRVSKLVCEAILAHVRKDGRSLADRAAFDRLIAKADRLHTRGMELLDLLYPEKAPSVAQAAPATVAERHELARATGGGS